MRAWSGAARASIEQRSSFPSVLACFTGSRSDFLETLSARFSNSAPATNSSAFIRAFCLSTHFHLHDSQGLDRRAPVFPHLTLLWDDGSYAPVYPQSTSIAFAEDCITWMSVSPLVPTPSLHAEYHHIRPAMTLIKIYYIVKVVQLTQSKVQKSWLLHYFITLVYKHIKINN